MVAKKNGMTLLIGVAIAFVFLLCSCGANEDKAAKEAEWTESIVSKLLFDADVSVALTNDIVHVDLVCTSGDLAFLGNNAYDAFNICDDVFGDDEYIAEVTYKIQNSEAYIRLSSNNISDREYVVVTDTRGYKEKKTSFASPEELCSVFPALKIHMAEEAVAAESPEEMEIYNHVWEMLDAEPNRDEMEIFEEVGPEYGMTAQEMSDFINMMMEKIY